MFTAPTIDDVQLTCETLPAAFDGLTILHLSDLHVTHWTRRLAAWQELLASERPDVVVITGDLGHRSWMWQKAVPTLERFLAPLKPPLGTWFILGNHDSLKLGPALVNADRRMLENEAVILRLGEARLAMVGLKQHRRIDTDIPAAMRNVRAGDFKLFLMHYPDLIHAAIDAGADVCLAGHTHGGQICYPDGSPILSHDVLPAEMTTGIHQVEKTWLVVNRGIGVAGIRVRMFCPPQVIRLTLRCAERVERNVGPRFDGHAARWESREPVA